MSLTPTPPLFVAGIIESFENNLLIVLPKSARDPRRLWQFPRSRATRGEAPEKAMRRFARKQLGVELEIVVGQPPFLAAIEGEEVEMRYFICGVAHGEVMPGPYAEIRWIPRAHLLEYDLDEQSKPVAEWLLQA